MSKNWLFLRGEWDEHTQKSIDTDDDMWLQLFDELGGANHSIWFKGEELLWTNPPIYNIYTSSVNRMIDFVTRNRNDLGYIFARGGFDYYIPVLKACPNTYKIRYGAGKRYMPEPEIDYQLVLVDTEKQKAEVLAKYPKANVHLFIKPAARHFKPVDVEKEYGVVFIANGQQAKFKGIEWVYSTAPKYLKILHLGYPSKFNPPYNITCKRVDRIDMPAEINKCRVGIVPYENIDSCPRVIPEMLACGLPLVVLDTVNFCRELYIGNPPEIAFNGQIADKEGFWGCVEYELSSHIYHCTRNRAIPMYYQENLSIPIAAKHIKELING